MLYTEQYRTKCTAKNPGDQSGPRSKRGDSMQTSSWSSSSHTSSSVRQPRQQKLTPAEAHSSRRSALRKKVPPVERICVPARRQGPTTETATAETSHASRSRSSSSSSSSQQAHDLLWICWGVPLTMWTEAVFISASRYCNTSSRQQRSRRYFLCSRDDDVML